MLTIADLQSVNFPTEGPHPPDIVFLPAFLVFSRNLAEGLRTLDDARLEPNRICLWNKNSMRFDVFTIVDTCLDRHGWFVYNDHPRWNLKP